MTDGEAPGVAPGRSDHRDEGDREARDHGADTPANGLGRGRPEPRSPEGLPSGQGRAAEPERGADHADQDRLRGGQADQALEGGAPDSEQGLLPAPPIATGRSQHRGQQRRQDRRGDAE